MPKVRLQPRTWLQNYRKESKGLTGVAFHKCLTAMRLFHNFKMVTIFSAVLSVLCALSGIVISILAGTPVGSTIVAADVAAFAMCYAAGMVTGGARR